MQQTPFFSIIIPTYNRADILPRAIQSVVDQDFTDWELIIVDDGSEDETREVVKDTFSNRQIRYHWQENKELNGARNTGVRLSKGQYLIFLDDDDSFLNNHLDVLHAHIISLDHLSPVIRTALILKRGDKTTEGILYDAQKESAVSFMWHHAVNLLSFAFHRSVFKELAFDEQFLLGDDFHFLMQLFFKHPLVQIKEHTVVYYLHETNRTVLYFEKHHLENKIKAMDLLWKNHEDELSKHISKGLLKTWKSKQALHFSRTAFRQKDRVLGWFYFKKALSGFTFKQSRSFGRTAILGLFNI